MKNENKIEEQLIYELRELQQRISEEKPGESSHVTFEEKLSEQFEGLGAYLDLFEFLIVAIGTDQTISFINRKGCEILGYGKEDLKGKNWFDSCIATKNRKAQKTEFESVITRKMEPLKFCEIPILKRDGEELLLYWHNAIMKNRRGDVLGILCSGEDMTGTVRVQEKWLAAEERYREIFENAIEGIYRSTPQGKFIEINSAFARILGYDSPEEVKKSVLNIGIQTYVEPERRNEWICEAAKSDYGNFAVQIRRKDGSTRWVSNKACVIRDGNGEPVYFDGFVEDITERKQTEEKLRAAEEKYRGIYENAIEGIFRTTPAGRVLDANPAFARIFGYGKPEEMKCAITDIGRQLYVEPDKRKEWMAFVDRQDYGRFEVQMRSKNGDVGWIFLSARPVRDIDGKTIYYEGFAEDITLRKKAEEELMQYRCHLEEMVKERTIQLEKRNQQLISEIAEREKVKEALLESEKELRIKAQNLMEVNTTMDVLLRTMEKDQEELKERFLANITEQVLPYLGKLKKTPLNNVQQGFIRMAESSLGEIASPFVQKLTSSYLNLTKKEIQVAALIKEGKTTKEIAELLDSSLRVIEFHRENIRKKLGIKNKKGNLQILLRSFS